MTYIQCENLQVNELLYNFIVDEVLDGTGLSEEQVWSGLNKLINSLGAENARLLSKRAEIQGMIDCWHRKHQDDFTPLAYQQFLSDIAYLVPEGEDFFIETTNVDDEVACIAGPQLVVPVKNARFALNAANARWGSLYDALYGTDAISDEGGAEAGREFNPVRGEKVIAFAKRFLDDTFVLGQGSHVLAQSYAVESGTLKIFLTDGSETTLADAGQFVGYKGEPQTPAAILLKNNDLHVEIVIDKAHPIGKTDAAGIADIQLESAITTIQDCEDSIAAVDCEDKVEVYSNWLGLMQGTLSASLEKNGKTIVRELNADRDYLDVTGSAFTLSGRSLMFIRNVGHLMTTDAVLTEQNEEIPEGLLDGFMSGLIGIHDLRGNSRFKNSKKGSIYIVKPKMHGPDEVAFATKSFSLIEEVLGLEKNTLKMGIMDEERRTSVNLKECIRQAKDRVVFINTGFLDRTGDEIHTSMQAGAFLPKADMKNTPWIKSYEARNVQIGLQCGLRRKAQIGKGMWAMPDLMSAMLEQKIAHPKSGATTAWVPSPTAATLHVMHYHAVKVLDVQDKISQQKPDELDDILTIPLLGDVKLTKEQIAREIDNNIQGILGYVTRWIDQGVGCSKVPDINNVGLMEDRATLRISSQYLSNWLHHNICTREQIIDSIQRMAAVVDQQNADDELYEPLLPYCMNGDSDFKNRLALVSTCDLIFNGKDVTNGYTEPALHRHRKEQKKKAATIQAAA